jgi:hypothetical protein
VGGYGILIGIGIGILIQNRKLWWALVNMAMNFQVP